jgi:hypothetical protein
MARAARRVTAKEEPSFGLRPSLKMRTPERMMAVGLPSSPNRNIAQPNDVDPKSNANRYAPDIAIRHLIVNSEGHL